MEIRNISGQTSLVRNKLIDGVELCFCSAHYDFLPCENFSKNKTYHHGFHYRCFECENLGIKSKWEPNIKKEESEKKTVQELLQHLGYDTLSNTPIYQQFLNKHNL